MIPKRTWTAGPNNNKKRAADQRGRCPSYHSAPRSVGVREEHLHLHWGRCRGVGGSNWPAMPDVSHPAPCDFVPRISPIDSTTTAQLYFAAPGIVGRRVKWKRKWKRTSCPAGAGRALRNISAATFRGRPPGNDAGSDRLGVLPLGACPSAPRWTKVDKGGQALSCGPQPGLSSRDGRAPSGAPDSCRPVSSGRGQKKKSRQS